MKVLVKRKYILTGLVSAMIAMGIWQMSASAVTMSSLTSESIREMEEQIKNMEKQQDNLKNNLTDLEQVKKSLEDKKSNLKTYVAHLDNQLAGIEKKIADLKAQIVSKEGEIELTQSELETALATEQNQQESMIIRIRLMYEKNGNQMLESFFSASSFSDFLNRADYIERVMVFDKQMYAEYKATRHLVELCKEQLELEKAILDQSKENVEIEQANLEYLIAQKNRDITQYETDITNKAQAIAEYEQMLRDQEAEIAALEEAIAEEKKNLLASSGSVLTYDNGVFKFPLASYTKVTDDYGMRIHPTLGVEQFHNGVDFAAPKGTAIYAAYDGKVVAAAYSAAMGNYVMIDHGSNLYTIYMHASALYVEKGDIVVRGETIAAVGSTGRSTGNHLHFSVRRNGAYETPWNYLSN